MHLHRVSSTGLPHLLDRSMTLQLGLAHVYVNTFSLRACRLQISDVVLTDASTDVGARNVRRLCAVFTGPTAGFEIVHGLVDRVMQLTQVSPPQAHHGSECSLSALHSLDMCS